MKKRKETHLGKIFPQRQERREADESAELKRMCESGQEGDDSSLRETAQHNPLTRPFLLFRRPKIDVLSMVPLRSNTRRIPLSDLRPRTSLDGPSSPSPQVSDEERPFLVDQTVDHSDGGEEGVVVAVGVRIVGEIADVKPGGVDAAESGNVAVGSAKREVSSRREKDREYRRRRIGVEKGESGGTDEGTHDCGKTQREVGKRL
jgi:hypothetical protein